MSIIPNITGKQFNFLSSEQNYHEIRITDSTNFNNTSLDNDFNHSTISPGWVDSINPSDCGQLLFVGDDGIDSCVTLVNFNHTDSGNGRVGIERNGFNVTEKDFDFRFRIADMELLRGFSDNTQCFVIGMMENYDLPIAGTTGGRFYMAIDCPDPNLRRLRVIFGKHGFPDTTLFQKTEDFTNQFGFSTENETSQILGTPITWGRLYRAGHKLGCEWNYLSDSAYTDDVTGSGFQKTFRNKIEYFGGLSRGIGVNGPSLFGGSYNFRAFIRSDILSTSLSEEFNSYVSIDKICSIPAICVDTTGNPNISDTLHYNGNVVGFLTKKRGEGLADLRITQWKDINLDGFDTTTAICGQQIQFFRKEILSGKTAGFMYDNKLIYPKSSQEFPNVYVKEVIKNENNIGNLQPSIYTTSKHLYSDITYNLQINKSGNIQEVLFSDSTDDQGSITKAGTYYIQNNLPSFVFNDGTHVYGRDLTFRPIDTIKLSMVAGETAIPDNYRAFERDSTSYILLETITDGTHFILYSRIWNIYNKSLSSRSRINTDISSNWNYRIYGSGNREVITTTDFKPNPHIMIFNNKILCAYTATVKLTGVTPMRIFIESFDNGLTWQFNDKDSVGNGLIRYGGNSIDPYVVDFKISNNDKYFFNFYTSGDGIFGQFHNVLTKNRSPNYLNAISRFSRVGPVIITDNTNRNLSCCFDPIQEKISTTVSYLRGQVEVINSKKIVKNSMKNFDGGGDLIKINAYLTPITPWKSEYLIRPFGGTDGTSSAGYSFSSYDKAGDLVIISAHRFDSTQFVISRTTPGKDDLNVLGRFKEPASKVSTRNDRFYTNMFTDLNGDIILSGIGSDSTNIQLSIYKYGQLSNFPLQLDYDAALVGPDTPVAVNGTIATRDSTTNGYILSASGVFSAGFNDIATTQAGVFRANKKQRGGFGQKVEWQSFCEPNIKDSTANSCRLITSLIGEEVNSTTSYKNIISIGWDITSIFAYDEFTGNFIGKGNTAFNPRILRRYMANFVPTDDFSVRGQIFMEDLNISNIEKIVWKKLLDFVIPQTTSTTFNDRCYFQNATGQSLHYTYLQTTRDKAPIQPARGANFYWPSEKLAITDFSNYENMNGIPISPNIEIKLHDGIRVNWSGLDGNIKDSWKFSFVSRTGIDCLVDKQIVKTWRSVSDNTDCSIVFDASNQSNLNFITANVGIFANSNFRRCFVEVANGIDLRNPNTSGTLLKEVFFDIDNGTLALDCTNYGNATIIPCADKNWRINEHKDRFFQVETCRIDGTPFRHMAFKIIENGQDSLKIRTTGVRFDTTAFMRYVIYDPKISVDFGSLKQYQNWRIRIPSNQIHNSDLIGDETSQGSVFLEGYRELGEFDLGILQKPTIDLDQELTVEVLQDVQIDQFENFSSLSYELSKTRLKKKISYKNSDEKVMNKIVSMFKYLQGSGKTLWFFEDQVESPREFMLCRIISEPQVIIDSNRVISISLEIEEIS